MLKHRITIAILLAAGACAAQQTPTPPADGKPQVKVNYINACAPTKEDQAVIHGGLDAVAAKPVFSEDFEISRGRTTMKDAPNAKFVRLRRDFPPDSPLLTAQFSMSSDSTNTIEILVLRLRDPKEFYEISIEDRVSAGAATPATVLSADTPASRVRIERMGKSSAVLSRCPETDQSAYDGIFRRASEIMAQYRTALGLRTTFRSDVGWLASAEKSAEPVQKKKAARKP